MKRIITIKKIAIITIEILLIFKPDNVKASTNTYDIINNNNDNYSININLAPRHKIKIKNQKLIITTWDNTETNTILYKIKNNKQKEIKLTLLTKTYTKENNYKYIYETEKILTDKINNFHIIITDNNQNKNNTYFIIKKNGQKNYAPSIKNNTWNTNENKDILFTIKDNNKIKTIKIHDMNNNNKLITSKENINKKEYITKLPSQKLNSINEEYYIKLITIDTKGNKSTRNIRYKIIKQKILILGNSKTWFSGDNLEKHDSTSNEFIQMAYNANYISSTINTNDIKKPIEKIATIFINNKDVTIATKSGSNIDKIFEKYEDIISNETYNKIIIQEQYGRISKENDYTETLNGIKEILNKLKNKNSNIYIRTSWPNKTEYFIKEINIMNNNLNSIINILKKDKNYSSFNFYGIHEAKAIEAAYNNYQLFNGDKNNHPNKYGAYLVGACIYSKLFNSNAKELNYNSIIEKNIANELADIAYTECNKE